MKGVLMNPNTTITLIAPTSKRGGSCNGTARTMLRAHHAAVGGPAPLSSPQCTPASASIPADGAVMRHVNSVGQYDSVDDYIADASDRTLPVGRCRRCPRPPCAPRTRDRHHDPQDPLRPCLPPRAGTKQARLVSAPLPPLTCTAQSDLARLAALSKPLDLSFWPGKGGQKYVNSLMAKKDVGGQTPCISACRCRLQHV